MTNHDLLLIQNQAKQELAKRSYEHYVEYAHSGIYTHARHTKFLCNKIDELLKQGNKRIMVFMPPRHSKSMTITETLPSYFLLNNPDKRVIITSYSDDLAQTFGRKNRHKVQEFGKQMYNLTVAKDKANVKNWDIQGYRGGLTSSGVGGALTGKGADLMIIDDPVKNSQEANSITYRNRVYDEYTSSLITRLEPNGSVVLIMTRWHEDDLAGRLLTNEREKWDIVSFPAICEDENDTLGRKIGEPLWSKRGFDLKWSEATKKSVGSRVWASLYQQRPSPDTGNIFDRNWWRFYTNLPTKLDRVVQSWDFAFKDSKTSDYVVGQVWGKIGADIYLIDQFRAKADFVKSLQAVRQMSDKYPNARQKYMEDKANGSAIIASLKKEINGILPIDPKSSKTARAYAVTPEIESGNVFLPSPEKFKWVEDFVEECTVFPNGKNDDSVDAMTQALSQLQKRGWSSL